MSLRVAIVLVSAALLTACGTTSPGGGDPAPSTTASDATDPSGPGGTVVDGFPVVLTRVGGIAGFNDRVSVAADGTATVSTKRGPASTCRLTEATLDRLRTAVTGLSSTGPATPSRGVADDLVTAVETPLTKGPVRLSDAPQGAVTVVGELLADVTGNPPAHTLCTPT